MHRLKKIYSRLINLPRNNFFIGAGSVFNLAGNYNSFNFSQDPGEADAKALAYDWKMVSQDLNSAFNSYPINKATSCKITDSTYLHLKKLNEILEVIVEKSQQK